MTPYLFFNGNCEEAMNFYAQCLGGQIMGIIRYKDVPGMPEDQGHLVMNCMLQAEGINMMASDNPSGPKMGDNVSLCANLDTEANMDEVFAALSAGGGNVHGPVKEFWGEYYASFTDKYGIYWMLRVPAPAQQ